MISKDNDWVRATWNEQLTKHQRGKKTSGHLSLIHRDFFRWIVYRFLVGATYLELPEYPPFWWNWRCKVLCQLLTSFAKNPVIHNFILTIIIIIVIVIIFSIASILNHHFETISCSANGVLCRVRNILRGLDSHWYLSFFNFSDRFVQVLPVFIPDYFFYVWRKFAAKNVSRRHSTSGLQQRKFRWKKGPEAVAILAKSTRWFLHVTSACIASVAGNAVARSTHWHFLIRVSIFAADFASNKFVSNSTI